MFRQRKIPWRRKKARWGYKPCYGIDPWWYAWSEYSTWLETGLCFKWTDLIAFSFGKSYNIMHQRITGLCPFYREKNVVPWLVLLKLAGVWQGCQYPQGFLEKSHVSFTKSCTALSLCIYSLCDCHVTLCGLLLALQKASCSLYQLTCYL